MKIKGKANNRGDTGKSSKSSKSSHKVCSSRNLGHNYALAWPTGGGTHLTLVYLENVKKGYEQDRVKLLAEEFLKERNVPTTLKLELPTDLDLLMWTERCVAVHDIVIAEIQQGLWDYFRDLGFQLRPLRQPHIDLRGESTDILDREIETRNWLH